MSENKEQSEKKTNAQSAQADLSGRSFPEASTGGQPQMPPIPQVEFRGAAPALPGSAMLKVCSILYIIIGALSIIVSLATAASVNGTFTTIGIILLVFVDGGAAVSGIVGLGLCKRPSSAAFFIAVGIAFIPLWVLFIAYGGGASLGMGIIVLAVLYIIGGAKLRKSRSITRDAAYTVPSAPAAYVTPPVTAAYIAPRATAAYTVPQANTFSQQPVMPKPVKATKPPKATKAAAAGTVNIYAPNNRDKKDRTVSGIIIGGIALFVLIIGILLGSGILWQNNTGSNAPPVIAENPGSDASVWQQETVSHMPADTSEITQHEQALLSELDQKLPAMVLDQGKEISGEKLFLAALEHVQYREPVFTENGLTLTLLLPNPDSLQTLNIQPYTPHTDAQTYIKESYSKLCGVGSLPDRAGYDVTIPYLSAAVTEKMLDWQAPTLLGVLFEYSDLYELDINEYMKSLGFYDAAKEILMPDFQDWNSHKGTNKGAAYLGGYFKGLAEALSVEGVNYNGKLTVDAAKIEQILEERFSQVWAFDSLEVKTENFQQKLFINTFLHVDLYHNLYTMMDAQYQAGQLARPSSLAALESIYMDAAKKQVNDMFGDLAMGTEISVRVGQYRFGWESLGTKGISACPEFVSEIREFLNSYDFYLMFLAADMQITQ